MAITQDVTIGAISVPGTRTRVIRARARARARVRLEAPSGPFDTNLPSSAKDGGGDHGGSAQSLLTCLFLLPPPSSGTPYSLLIPRSEDFKQFGDVIKARYPDPVDRMMVIQVGGW